MDSFNFLRQRIQQLEQELAEVKQKNAALESARGGGGPEDLPISLSEFEETLRRLVQRTAMIVQAEKCVIMVRDRETGHLVARSPAFGMSEEDVRSFRMDAGEGISGAVFSSGQPAIFDSPDTDPRAATALLKQLKIRNGVTVPLLIEKRDDMNHIVDRITIGVLHCFNKRYGGDFIEEDVRLLERLSRNAAAVIANAQMFQEVVEENQKLLHTLESLTAGLLLITQQERVGQMNAQARAMFGIAEDANPIGKPFGDVIRHEHCLEILKRKIEQAQKPRDPEAEEAERRQPDEILVEDKDGIEYIYQVHAASVRDDKDEPIGTVVIFNDVTDLRNVERMKTEFVSIVSHELRTPLTPMKGFVRTLLDDENEEWYQRDDRREFYGIIDENVDRLSRLINDLLNVSRIEKMGAAGIEVNFDIIDVRKSTESVVTMQKGRTDKHTLVIDFEPETIMAETDADLFQNVLHNLISNAIKYSPEGGEVRIIGRVEPATDEQPESLLIGVKDQGLGIPESYLKQLGKKFVRVPGRKIDGTGIGLFLVTNIIARHNGVMWPESEGPGKGSTFWFRFPMRQPQTEETMEAA